MKFKLVFEHTGDEIPLTVVKNHELFEYFIDKANTNNNLFFDNDNIGNRVEKNLKLLKQSITETNKVFKHLCGQEFPELDELEYLHQPILNKLHHDWRFTQEISVDIDQLRFSDDEEVCNIGSKLHEMYPDEIRVIKVAEALDKLGYLKCYEDINDRGIHDLERSFDKLTYTTSNRYDVFDNPLMDMTESCCNCWTNFMFDYTYLGRESYDKFQNFEDQDLYPDHFNFDKLEYTFGFNLRPPEDVPFSKEFIAWSKNNNMKPMGTKIPIANIPDLSEKQTEYRKIIYNNSIQQNKLAINYE